MENVSYSLALDDLVVVHIFNTNTGWGPVSFQAPTWQKT